MIRKNSGLGYGQTFKNLTASRALNTAYTNSTGKPILVVVELNVSVTTVHTILVDSVTLSSHACAPSGVAGQMYSFIVPNNSSYMVQNGSSTLIKWHELR